MFVAGGGGEKGGGGTDSLSKASRRKGRRPRILRGSIFNCNYAVVVSARRFWGLVLSHKRRVSRAIQPAEGIFGERFKGKKKQWCVCCNGGKLIKRSRG